MGSCVGGGGCLVECIIPDLLQDYFEYAKQLSINRLKVGVASQ